MAGSPGRPSKYKREYAKQAKTLCELGATTGDLAKAFDVNISTIRLWQVQHGSFSTACRLGKEKADDRVEHSLHLAAIGYETEETHTTTDNDGLEVVKTVKKQVPPSPVAAKLWLTNRRPDEWREKVDHDHQGNVTFIVDTGILRDPGENDD